ncbi:MAG: gamma-glutamylcyclotransferase family protein [Roseovarius sp.]
MTHPAYFFGYGSLVNRDTHQFEDAQTAQLQGWRRMWRHTPARQVAYLTVVPDETSQIDGLIAAVPDQDWAALDHRERAYDRVQAAHQITHSLGHAPDLVVYAIPDQQHATPTRAGPVLLSYIDVVIQGYLREFGETGAAQFFDTTHGWDAPILADRDDPRYPRHCRLSPSERDCVDTHLEHLGVRFITSL